MRYKLKDFEHYYTMKRKDSWRSQVGWVFWFLTANHEMCDGYSWRLQHSFRNNGQSLSLIQGFVYHKASCHIYGDHAGYTIIAINYKLSWLMRKRQSFISLATSHLKASALCDISNTFVRSIRFTCDTQSTYGKAAQRGRWDLPGHTK